MFKKLFLIKLILMVFVFSSADMSLIEAAEVPSNTLILPLAKDSVDHIEAQGIENKPVFAKAIIPENAKNMLFTLGDIIIDNEFDELKLIIFPLIQSKLGERISIAELYEVAAQIQEVYFKAGYSLVRIVIPPQDINVERSDVHFLLINGFIERIDLSSLPRSLHIPVENLLLPLLNKKSLKQKELTRRVLLAGDVAGLQLTSSVGPGEEMGGVILFMNGAYKPITMDLDFDNTLSKEAGRNQIVFSGTGHSLANMGDMISLIYAGHPDKDLFKSTSPRHYGEINFVMPIKNDGLSLMLNCASSQTNAIGQAAPAKIHSKYNRAMMRLMYPVVRERNFNLYTWGNLELTTQKQTSRAVLPEAIIGNDRLRVIRIGIDSSHFDKKGGIGKYMLRVSRGLGLGARSKKDATIDSPLSREGASAIFTSIQLSADYTMSLFNKFEGYIKIKGQTSFNKPLLTSEQIAMGGAEQLSAFNQGEIYADEGGFSRVELRLPKKIEYKNIKGVVKPYLFFAYGKALLKKPSNAESGNINACNYGVGFYLPLSKIYDLKALEYGYNNPVEIFLEFGKGRVQSKTNNTRFITGVSINF